MRRNDPGERPRSRSDLIGWYAKALAAQLRSGLSIAEYARQIGVTAASLYQWRRRLRAGGAPGRSLSTGGSSLVELVVSEGHRGGDRGTCAVVRLGSGRTIEVPCGFDDEDLRRLVTLLESC